MSKESFDPVIRSQQDFPRLGGSTSLVSLDALEFAEGVQSQKEGDPDNGG
jgi:hypothetical protein